MVDITNVLPRAHELEDKIGPDFLTWMWSRLQQENNDYTAGGIPFKAYIDGEVTITSSKEKLTAKAKGGDGTFKEINAGIEAGKRVDSAVLYFEYGEGGEHWAGFKLSANLFPIVEIAIPNAKVRAGEEFDGSLMQQIGTIEEAYARLRLLLVCYATMFKPEAIALGLQPTAINELREMPDMIADHLPEGGVLVSFRNSPCIAKALPPAEEEAA